MPQLSPGDAAPAFTLTTDQGEQFSLDELAGRKAVLYFYPEAMTPGCTTQACDFRDSLASLEGAGYRVVGISRDEPATLAAFRERDGIGFTLLSDPDHAVHEAYGAWGEKNNYGNIVTGVIRSTFVIDESARITHALVNVKATGHVKRLRALLGID